MVDHGGALVGRRVVVTRSADQVDRLSDLLRAHGAVPVEVPLIEIVTDPLEVAHLADLRPAEFDWLVVTSPNGARHYLSVHPRALPTRIACVGSVTAGVLDRAGCHVDLVPGEQSASGLLAEFPAVPQGSVGSVLVVQAFGAAATMADGLAEMGWNVTVVAPYRSVSARPTAGEQLAAYAADAVFFASGSAARAWADALGTSTPSLVVAIGPQTAAAAAAVGLKVDLVAADHSLQGLVDALERHLTGSG